MNFNTYVAPKGFMYKHKIKNITTKILHINKDLKLEEHYEIVEYKEES
jgi:hypothetical protein